MRAQILNHYYLIALLFVVSWVSRIFISIRVISLFLLSISAFAQPKFKVFDTEDGLSGNYVSSIMVDRSGYLWVGTEDGLNRFDGNSFKVYKYNPNDENSIASNQVSCLAVDKFNKIWIGHASSITRYDPSTNVFTRYKIDKTDSTSICWITFISFDKSNRAWLSVVGSGLIVLDPESGEIERKISTAHFMEDNFHINGVLEDSSGNVWLATKGGLYFYDRKLDVVKPLPIIDGSPRDRGDDNFKGILDDGEGGFWLASYHGGICHYFPKQNTFVSYKYENSQSDVNLVLDFAWKSKTEFWLINKDKGKPIGIFDIQKKTYTFLKLPYILESEIDPYTTPFSDLFVGRDGIVWVASKVGLVMINPGNTLNLKTIYEADTRIKIRSIVDDTVAEKRFIASDQLGLIVTNLKGKKGNSFAVGVDGVQDLLNTRGDSLWVISSNKVRLFNKVREKWIDLPALQKLEIQMNSVDPYLKRMIKASSGDYWIITYNHGAYYLRGTDLSFKHLMPNPKIPNSISSNSITALLEDKFGRIWFASHDAGICIFDPADSSFKTLSNDKKGSWFIPTNDVSDLDIDSGGNVWLATLELGVMRINVVSKDSLNLTIFDQEMLTSGADQLKLDGKGRVWFRTLNGVNVMDPNTMHIKFIEKSDGLLDVEDHNLLEFNDRVMVNGSKGSSLIDEKDLLPDITANPFVVNSIKVFGIEIYPNGENNDHIELPYDQNSVAIDFAAIDFKFSKKIKYSYKLEGLEGNEWTTPSSNRSTEFAHLDGGDYIFKVKVSNQEGIWSQEKNLLYIHIETPFWKTKWFYASLAGLGIGIIASIYWYQINRIRKREKEIRTREQEKSETNRRILQLQLKALHTQMRPHFIFNCLSAINSHIIKFETIKASEFLSQFSRLMRGILENSTESWITLEQEIETLRLYLIMEGLRFEEKLSYKIEVEEGIDPTKTLIPSMILQPYVENAIGHGLLHKKHGIGIINIKFLKGDGNLKCIIEDNGIGREYSAQLKDRSKASHKSLGMQITSERLHLLQGSAGADIQDLKNELGEPIGTRIIVILMTKQAEEKEARQSDSTAS